MELDDLTLSDTVRAQLAVTGQTTNLWPLLVNRERAVVAVDDEGLRVFGTDAGVTEHPWSEVAEVRVEQMALCVLMPGDPTPVRYPLMRIGDRRALAEAIAAGGGPIVAAPVPAMRVAPEAPVDRVASGTARSLLASAFVSGVAGLLVGWSVIGVAWSDDEENPVVVLLGIAVATFGGFALLLAVIGWGVMLGSRAIRDD